MKRKVKEFQRLPGRGADLISYQALFLGRESLVQVVSTFGFHERYNRFAYADIQGITIRKTALSSIINTVFGLAVAFTIGSGIFYGGTTGADSAILVLAGIGTVLFSIPLAYSLISGPSCVCHVRTAIQSVRLRSLSRRRNVNKALAKLQPLIAAAQGTLSREDLAQSAGTAPSTPSTSAEPPIVEAAEASDPGQPPAPSP